nr:wssv007 [White spot syndrome virus]AYV99448.1 WSSV140 [White spot syndrome virus]
MTADMTSAIEEECTAAVADGSFWRDMRYEMVAHQHDVTFAAKNMEGYEEFAAEVRRVEG